MRAIEYLHYHERQLAMSGRSQLPKEEKPVKLNGSRIPVGGTSRHFQTIKKLLRANPNMKYGFFRQAVIAALKQDKNVWLEDYDELLRCGPLAVVPDAYEIDLEKAEIHVIEVEGSNRLSKAKLRKYADLWFYLDCDEWDLHLHIFDDDGLFRGEFPLCDAWYRWQMFDYVPTLKSKEAS